MKNGTPSKSIPSKLYKYVSDDSFQKHLASFLNAEVLLSRWQDMNDPMEGFFMWDISKDPSKATNVIVTIEKKSEYLVSCFSRNPTNVLLWSHYANKHKGVCIEYAVPDKFDGYMLEEVKYCSSLPNLDTSALPNNESVRGFLLRKSRSWQYEKEFRLLRQSPLPMKYPFGKITSITFGLRWARFTPTRKQKKAWETLTSTSTNTSIKLYKADMNEKSKIIRRKYQFDDL